MGVLRANSYNWATTKWIFGTFAVSILVSIILYATLPRFWKTTSIGIAAFSIYLLFHIIGNGITQSEAVTYKMGGIVAREIETYRGREGHLPKDLSLLGQEAINRLRTQLAEVDCGHLETRREVLKNGAMIVEVGRYRMWYNQQIQPPALTIQGYESPEVYRDWDSHTRVKKPNPKQE